ncbi:hypothetical protein OF83DRAFT_275009 [Amylostereum chailletii]|nr:hypothetical protein OF83DRAFT_275009 [Amylostereum chailletii]
MIMVQKPVHLLSSPVVRHRRLPSAPPAVLIQPTRTPGLLSLSKPAQPLAPRSQQRQQQQRTPRPQKSRGANPNPRSPQPSKPQSQPAEPSDEASSKVTTAVATSDAPLAPKAKAQTSAPTDNSPRGRQNGKASKDRSIPSTSHSSVPTGRRRQPHHQASPPQPSVISSRADTLPNPAKRPDAARPPSSQSHNRNAFDLFRASPSDSDSDTALPTTSSRQDPNAMKLASRPTGKLARRRQVIPEPVTPTPSRAVPVPRGKNAGRAIPAMNVSRSAPGVSSAPSKSVAAFRPRDVFPICDDLTDVEEDGPPVTPTREKSVTWQQRGLLEDGPRTAPLSSVFTGMPFFARTTTPTPSRRRNHARSPSEGVFNMSMDEDSSTSSSTSDASEELKALVGLLPRRRVASASPSARQKDVRPGFFASSTFQNSPSPDELPAPF